MPKTKNEIREQRGKILLIVILILPLFYGAYYVYLMKTIGKDTDSLSELLDSKVKQYENMKATAIQFGNALDKDDFELTKALLAADCEYLIGDTTLIGAAEIVGSYEANMIEGRKKMDKLEWGKSEIEPIGEQEYYVHFTDYLTHQGETHTHRCRQKLTINKAAKIIRIVHIHNPEEQRALNAFYNRVGIPITK